MTSPGPEAILEALAGHGVDFVIIGGLAAVAHGSRRMTRDIDVVVSPDDDNLARLERVLRDLGAVQLVEHAGEKEIEPADIAMIALGSLLHTRSPAGRLDVVGAPAGAAPYPQLKRRAISSKVGDVQVMVAGLDDLIAMKRASGRPLDLQDIADLTARPTPKDVPRP